MDNREIYITRIKQDLIGPNGELDEVIDEVPGKILLWYYLSKKNRTF